MGGQTDKVADIAVSACRMIDDSSDIASGSVRNLGSDAVQILFNFIYNIALHLFSVAVQELYAVIIIRVMACTYHYAAVKSFRTRNVCDARRGGNMHKVDVRSAGGEPGSQRTLIHVGAAPCVLAYNNGTLMLTPIVAAEKAADFECVLNGELFIGFAAEAVGTKVFRHINSLRLLLITVR